MPLSVLNLLVWRKHASRVLPDHVALDLHVPPNAQFTERRVRQRVLDERELHDIGEREIHEQRVALRLDVGDRRNAIDVAEHEMAAEARSRQHRALEIHSASHSPLADGGALERRRDRGYGEPARSVLANREARAIERDALAAREIVVATAHAQLTPPPGVTRSCSIVPTSST